MNRFVILALVAATAVSARSLETLEGANRGLKCSGPSCTQTCEVKTSLIVDIQNEYKLRTACDTAIKRISTQICKDATGYLVGNQDVTETVSVVAKAVARSVAKASLAIYGGVSYKGTCDYGSFGKGKAEAAAIAYAKVVATATAQALVKVYGENTLTDVGIWIDATSKAITSACSSSIVKGLSEFKYAVGPPSAGWVTFTQPPVIKVTETVAKAIAKAYVDVVARIKFDVDAKKFPCDLSCPDCPKL